MDAGAWTRLSAASKRHHSRYDMYLGFEEMDAAYGEEDSRAEYPCPFCSEEYDIIGLCCHIADEHSVEAKKGVCPTCQVGFGPDMVAHITMEHGSFFKMQHRQRNHKGLSGSPSEISYLRRDLREGNLHAFGSSSHMVAPLSATTDPLLSSFMNLHLDDSSKDVQPHTLENGSTANRISDVKVEESIEPSLPDEDQEERARRCKFLQELVMSTIIDGNS